MSIAKLVRGSFPSIGLMVCALSYGARGDYVSAAASAPRPLSVRTALSLCHDNQAAAYSVTVTGYFRPGPVPNGPIVLIGGLFERNTVPTSAARSLDDLVYYHGLGFTVVNTSHLARSRVLLNIRTRSRLSVTGRLGCTGWSAIQPATIRILTSERQAPLRHHAPLRSEVKTDGVHLVLSVPERSYPRGALIRVTVRLDNLSGHDIALSSTQGVVCPVYGPGVRVIREAGGVAYSGEPHTFTTCGGIPLPPPVLAAGQSIVRKQFVVLRAKQLQAVALLGAPGTTEQVVTPPLSLVLTHGEKPRFTVHLTPVFGVRIRPPTAYQNAPLYFIQSCSDRYGSHVMLDWERAPAFARKGRTYLVQPMCGQGQEWYLTAGFLGEPVVMVRYNRLRSLRAAL